MDLFFIDSLFSLALGIGSLVSFAFFISISEEVGGVMKKISLIVKDVATIDILGVMISILSVNVFAGYIGLLTTFAVGMTVFTFLWIVTLVAVVEHNSR